MNVALLVFAVLFGVAGYQEARRFERQYGRTPWGWDPWVWAIVLFVSFLIGIILLAVAERQGRSQPAGPAPPQPANADQWGYGGYGQVAPPSALAQPAPSVAAGPPAAPSAGFWAADPSGRFDHRWWDGQQWTDHVSRAGVVAQDPPV